MPLITKVILYRMILRYTGHKVQNPICFLLKLEKNAIQFSIYLFQK